MINNLRVGTGFDVHKFVNNRPLVLGGLTIPWARGLAGHSDADVLVHAIMDSLLGAASLPDIGRLFPDSNSSYKDISSLELLKQVREKLETLGVTVVNIDSTIICEAPKIASHIEGMKKNISAALLIDPNQVGIKGTTTEKLGFTGREEGIAVQAVSLIILNS